MAAVADSSSLILYAAIDQLELLRAVYADLLVPDAVWTEVVAHGRGRPGGSQITLLPWMRRQAPQVVWDAPDALVGLGPGEADVIALALRLPPPSVVILDDRRARRVARSLGLTVIGSAGILVAAKEAGFLTQVQPLLAALRAAGLYLSDDLVREVLDRAGETPE